LSKTNSKNIPEFCPECFKIIKKKKIPTKFIEKISEKKTNIVEIPVNDEEIFPSSKLLNSSPEAEERSLITLENSNNDTTLIKEELDENESLKKSKQIPSPGYVK